MKMKKGYEQITVVCDNLDDAISKGIEILNNKYEDLEEVECISHERYIEDGIQYYLLSFNFDTSSDIDD